MYINGIEITKKEVITSITIISIMMIIGICISEFIQNKVDDQNSIYTKAVKIDSLTSNELFVYGMDTNVGNAFIYGTLKAIDPVTFPEIGGEYMEVEKIKEVYQMHTRLVSHTRTVNGKTSTYYTTEVYYSWDYAGSETLKCNEVTFCDVTFPSSKINLPSTNYIKTIKQSSTVRYKYYGSNTEYTGTLFSSLKDKTISENSNFFENKNLEEALEASIQSGKMTLILFWIMWICLTGGATVIFYSYDNRWLG